MNENGLNENFDWLVKTYFSNRKQRLHLKAGETLIRQGDFNNRLYHVRKGILKGFGEEPDGSREEIFVSKADSFIGVYSFFSKKFKSLATVTAQTDCELAYIDRNQIITEGEAGDSLEKQFMPVAVTELMHRQQRLQEVAREKEQAYRKLVETEKLASLGQLSAGIAHELNNAISVVSRNTSWLIEHYTGHINDPRRAAIFESALMSGRSFSSRKVRKRKKQLSEKYGISPEAASRIAQTGLDDKLIRQLADNLEASAQQIYDDWEIGATLHDMLLAAEQSTHVVKSIKTLGARHKSKQSGLDLNETIEHALSLLHHKLRNVNLQLNLNTLPPITGNSGEWVQVWMNLINNACEAMSQIDNREPTLHVESKKRANHIQVTIRDNGPGIPKEILPDIFNPNVTTKVSGLSFGLGLGLTIVQRIITDYHGTIDTASSKRGTKFILKIPVGEDNEKNKHLMRR